MDLVLEVVELGALTASIGATHQSLHRDKRGGIPNRIVLFVALDEVEDGDAGATVFADRSDNIKRASASTGLAALLPTTRRWQPISGRRRRAASRIERCCTARSRERRACRCAGRPYQKIAGLDRGAPRRRRCFSGLSLLYDVHRRHVAVSHRGADGAKAAKRPTPRRRAPEERRARACPLIVFWARKRPRRLWTRATSRGPPQCAWRALSPRRTSARVVQAVAAARAPASTGSSLARGLAARPPRRAVSADGRGRPSAKGHVAAADRAARRACVASRPLLTILIRSARVSSC